MECFLKNLLCFSCNVLFLFKKLTNLTFMMFSTTFKIGESKDIGL